jgi:hypothetical protein
VVVVPWRSPSSITAFGYISPTLVGTPILNEKQGPGPYISAFMGISQSCAGFRSSSSSHLSSSSSDITIVESIVIGLTYFSMSGPILTQNASYFSYPGAIWKVLILSFSPKGSISLYFPPFQLSVDYRSTEDFLKWRTTLNGQIKNNGFARNYEMVMNLAQSMLAGRSLDAFVKEIRAQEIKNKTRLAKGITELTGHQIYDYAIFEFEIRAFDT